MIYKYINIITIIDILINSMFLGKKLTYRITNALVALMV